MPTTTDIWALLRRLRNWGEPPSRPAVAPLREEGEAMAVAAAGAFGPTAGVNPDASPPAWTAQPVCQEPAIAQVIPFVVAPVTPAVPVMPAVPLWTLVLSDTDNDFTTVARHLQLLGLCDRRGCWKPGIPPVRIIHTGDWLNKWNPDPHVLDSFKRLVETAPQGVEISLLAGNHELAILRMADMGLRTPFTGEDLDFIRNGELFRIQDDILFLHGYPTLLLLELLHQLRHEGCALADLHGRLRAAFYRGEHALFRDDAGPELAGYIRKPRSYYSQPQPDGRPLGHHVAERLLSLGIATVIHGHKPVGVTQSDDELERIIPGVRVINNDNGVRTAGLGGLLISPRGGIRFINPEAVAAAGGIRAYRKRLRKRLATRGRDIASGALPAMHSVAA
ncbi:MAG: metallophosphoesterase [Magnetococcales bacterium]|nr:metallophosphoesterase [Magnetococcales bacterium]